MANEGINETEESNENETPVIEETKEEIAVETTAEETQVEAKAEETAVEAKTEETPVLQAEETASGDEQQSPGDVDFGAILEKFEADQTIYHSGELVEGKVVGVSDRGVLVDFGYKSEGAVPLEEFTSPEGEITVKEGDTVEVVIRNIHTGDGPPMLSRYDAIRRKSWDEIEKAFNEEVPIKGFVIDKTRGGLRVDINGIEAFLPGSQIDSRPFSNLDSYIGQEVEAKVIKFSRRRNNLVLSRKVLTDEVVNKQKAETLSKIEEGFVVEGVVKNLTQYGAFIDIGGIDGLLHVSDMFWDRVPVQHDPFKVNETVQVKILKLDREREKVSLGYKQLVPDPWQIIPEIYPIGAKVKGKVSSATDYGIFIELEPGIEGLVHASEMTWSKRSVLPKKLVRPQQEVEVQVLGIDTDDHRISLGMKQLMPNPWKTVGERYHVGDRIHGKVRNITDFGAFVEIEDGIDGLVHVSDITWSKRIKHPRDLLVRDQEVDAIITSIDAAGNRMSLSMKDIAPSEWESFIATHKNGDIVRGKVSRFAGFGVFAELGNELEGLCHISELSDERVDKPEDVVQIGQEMDFKILRIDHEDRRIGLSARAAAGSISAGIDARSYSTEAKGGMASLGELMKLKRGNAAPEEGAIEEPKLSKKERKAIKAQEKAEAESSESKAAEIAETVDAETATEAAVEEKVEPEVETESKEAVGVVEEKAEPEIKTKSKKSKAEVSETEASTEEKAEPELESRSSEAAAETTEIAAVETAAEESAEEKSEPEIETEIAETEAAIESETPETTSLTDTEGEAASAPEDTEPRDEVAEDVKLSEAENENSETSEETEEKTASN